MRSLLALIFLCALAKGQRIGILSDVNFGPQVLREVVRRAWTKSLNSFADNVTTNTDRQAFRENLTLIEDVVVADVSNAANTMESVCSLMKHDPAVVVAITRSACNLPLAVLSSALSIPVFEMPVEFRADPPHLCEFKMNDQATSNNNGQARQVSRLPPFDGAILGNYFLCHAGQRIILVYDDTLDTQAVSTFVEGLGNQMRRTTVQKLPLPEDFSSKSVLDLATELINDSVGEMWDVIEESVASKEVVNVISFVIFGGEETIQKFVLHYIPDLPYSYFVHYYIVDTGWTSYYFAQSLLFREGVTVITIPEKYEVSPTMSDRETNQIVERVVGSGFDALISSLYQSEMDADTAITGENSTGPCSTRLSVRQPLKAVASAIRTEVMDSQSDSGRFSFIEDKFPFFVSSKFGADSAKRTKLHSCDITRDGGIVCQSLTSQMGRCRENKPKVLEDTDVVTQVDVDSHNKDIFLGMTSWKNKTFRVATLEDEPFVFVRNDSKGHVKFSGFSIDLLHMLSEMLEFQYEIYEVADRKYGAFSGGKWNGLVGDVVSKKADFAIAAMTITPQRETVVDFTKRYMDYAVGILVKKPKTVTNLFAFLNPFDNTVWYSIIAGLFLVSILLYVLNRVSPKQMRGPPYHDTSLHGTFWFVYSSLVQQGTDMNLVTLSSQIVTGVWWFFILIIISSYTANLAAHLTITRLENHITSFRDLAKQSEIAFGTAKDTSIYDFLRTNGSNAKDHTSMWARLWKVCNGSNSVNDPKQGFNKVKNEHYAFLWDVAVIEYLILTDADCSFSTVPDSIYDKGYGIAVQQGNPIREALSLGILQLQDRGEINRLKQRWWTSVGKCPIDHSQKRSHSSELTLENFAGVFCVLACGLVIASLVAAVELMHYVKYTKKAKTKEKGNGDSTEKRNTEGVTGSREIPSVFVEKYDDNEIRIVLRSKSEWGCYEENGDDETPNCAELPYDTPLNSQVLRMDEDSTLSSWWPRNRGLQVLDNSV